MKKKFFLHIFTASFLLTICNVQILEAKSINKHKKTIHKSKKVLKKHKHKKQYHKTKLLSKYKKKKEPYSLRSKKKDPELLGPASTLKHNPLARL